MWFFFMICLCYYSSSKLVQDFVLFGQSPSRFVLFRPIIAEVVCLERLSPANHFLLLNFSPIYCVVSVITVHLAVLCLSRRQGSTRSQTCHLWVVTYGSAQMLYPVSLRPPLTSLCVARWYALTTAASITVQIIPPHLSSGQDAN
jgi:hypothetical protein